MAENILDLVKGAVSDRIMGQIGGLIGQTDNKKTSSIFGTATQAILGGLINKTSTPDGASDVFNSVESQDDGLMDKLGDLLDADNDGHLEKAGGGALDLIFGDQQNGMMEAIAKFLGLDGPMVGKLLKLAAPIIMGVVAKYVKSKALDAAGLGTLMGEQKSHLKNAMPVSLTSSLGLEKLLDNTTESAQNAPQQQVAGNTAASSNPAMKILLPIVLLGALALLGYTIMTGGFDLGNEIPPAKSLDGGSSTKMSSETESDADSNEFDLSALQNQFTTITDSFKDVTNDNVSAAATNMTALIDSLDSMGLEKLTGDAKESVGAAISKFIESVKTYLDEITDARISGILRPVANAMIEKLMLYQ